MRIEFNIAMMALAGIYDRYSDTNDKQALNKDMTLFTLFCEKYDLLDIKNNTGADFIACLLLISAMNDIIVEADLIKYREEHENNE